MSARLNPALPTHDLRSGAQASKRDKHHNTKWQNGVTTKSVKGCPQKPNSFQHDCSCGQCHTKPVGPWNHNQGQVKAQKLYKKDLRGQASTLARKAFRNDLVDAMDGPLAHLGSDPSSSSDDDVSDASAAPLPTGGTSLMYCVSDEQQYGPSEGQLIYGPSEGQLIYGPSEGQHILSNAVTAAVMRFENTQTEKLVDKEYDVIDGADEAHVATAAADDDHDFELIEHAHIM
ncbi:hypothetical protein DV737_g1659, partial [Chaetothyriales sp. CBS 132003]